MHPFKDFERVYIINLASRRDRREEMTRELEGLGVDAHESPIHWFDAKRPDAPAGFPTIGAHGCFLSHLGVLEDAAIEGLSRIVILEDDVTFCNGFDALFARATEALMREDWAFFYGGYALQGGTVDFGSAPIGLAPPEAGILLAHFMAVRGETIAELRDYLKRILTRPAGDPNGGPMHVDGAYSWYRRQHPARNTYVHRDMLARQRQSRSDIHVNKWFDKTPGVRRLASLARKLTR